jgi:hypothetical protein
MLVGAAVGLGAPQAARTKARTMLTIKSLDFINTFSLLFYFYLSLFKNQAGAKLGLGI